MNVTTDETSTNRLAALSEGNETIRWMLFWLKATCATQTKNVLIVRFHSVVRVVKFTDKLFASREKEREILDVHLRWAQPHFLII